jgi:hypothetical protein
VRFISSATAIPALAARSRNRKAGAPIVVPANYLLRAPGCRGSSSSRDRSMSRFGQNLIDSFVEAKYFARDHIVTNGGPPAISQTLLNRLAP